jgi:hypothetical protein
VIDVHLSTTNNWLKLVWRIRANQGNTLAAIASMLLPADVLLKEEICSFIDRSLVSKDA